MVAKIRREGIRFSVAKDQCADRVEESACDEQGHGSHAKLMIDGANQEDDDPAHEQETDIRHEHSDLREENGFESNEENGKAPNNAK